MRLEWVKFCDYITEVCGQYERTAPTVCEFADDLYRRLNDDADSVRVSEVLCMSNMREEGIWLQPNFAANTVYKLMSRLGQDTTGQAGF